MRKAALIFLLGLSMAACSVSDLTSLIPGTPTALPPTVTPTETLYVTSTRTPSLTPTRPTPTFTATPTLIFTGPTATPSDTPSPTGTLWTLNQGTPTNPVTAELNGFYSYEMGGDILHWGICQPNSIKVIAKPSDIVHTHNVLLFLRLQDRQSPVYTHWGSGAIMDSDGKGTFTYTLTAKNLPGYREFMLAWVEYQFVATDKKLNVIGRTPVVLNGIAYSPCP